MRVATRDDVKKAERRTVKIPCPELGDAVYVIGALVPPQERIRRMRELLAMQPEGGFKFAKASDELLDFLCEFLPGVVQPNLWGEDGEPLFTAAECDHLFDLERQMDLALILLQGETIPDGQAEPGAERKDQRLETLEQKKS